MSNGIIQSNDSVETYMKDAAMQETPIADHVMISNDVPHAADRCSYDTRSRGNGKDFSDGNIDEYKEDYYSSPLMDKNGGMNVLSKESRENEIKHLAQSPLRFNRRTPNIEKIADFFRNNRTPRQKRLLAQFDSTSTQDTPVSQRRDHSPLRAKDNKELSSTEYVRKLHTVNDEPSLEVTEADIQYKLNTDEEEKTSELQTEYGTPNRLKFFDQGSQSQEKLQTQEIKGSESFQNGSDYHEESRVNDTTDGDISVQWIFRSGKNDQGNSNKSTQIMPTRETQNDEINSEYEKTQQSFTQPNEIQTQVLASFNAQEISVDEKRNELESPTQIVRSPQCHTGENIQETPSRTNGFGDVGPVIEAPGTSPPSRSKDVIDVESRPSSPRFSESSLSRNDLNQRERDGQGKVLLQISGRPKSLPDFHVNQGKEENSHKDTAIVVSEAELTQDLPELEEQVTLEGEKEPEPPRKTPDASSGESQEVTKKTWKRGGRTRATLIQEEEEEEEEGENSEEEEEKEEEEDDDEKIDGKYSNHPKKKLRRGDIDDNSHIYVQTPDTSPDLDGRNSALKDQHLTNKISSEIWLEKIKDLSQDIRKRENDFLSKRDIKFEDAVWCQYDLNYCFYPGRLISYDEKAEGCWVVFETGKSLTRNDDIYYLDIRVGDTVNWNGKVHKVMALECRTQDPIVIRCIRGYDTVHLKKRNVSGKLGKKTSVVPLSSISLDLNEWTKRPKVILEEGSHTRTRAFKFLQHPIRGRKNIANLSPRKARVDSETMGRLTYKEDSDEESNGSIKSVSKSGIIELSFNLEPPGIKKKLFTSKDQGLFKDCLFVLSGLNEEKYELSKVISSLGGIIVDTGFSDLFDFQILEERDQQIEKYTLNLDWKSNIDLEKLRFGCLLSTKHLRSLKYLETLALGWPTLHWKFIERCVSEGKLCIDHIQEYLLPSGESFRLTSQSDEQSGVIKSSDIFQFYFLLLQNALLRDQMGHNYHILSGYVVLIFGHSGLDQFIRFILACLGVKIIFQISGKIGISTTTQNLNVLMRYTDRVLQEQENSKVIVYINGENGFSNKNIEELKERIWGEFSNNGEISPNFHVESKEWLIQTLINGNSGFN